MIDRLCDACVTFPAERTIYVRVVADYSFGHAPAALCRSCSSPAFEKLALPIARDRIVQRGWAKGS